MPTITEHELADTLRTLITAAHTRRVEAYAAVRRFTQSLATTLGADTLEHDASDRLDDLIASEAAWCAWAHAVKDLTGDTAEPPRGALADLAQYNDSEIIDAVRRARREAEDRLSAPSAGDWSSQLLGVWFNAHLSAARTLLTDSRDIETYDAQRQQEAAGMSDHELWHSSLGRRLRRYADTLLDATTKRIESTTNPSDSAGAAAGLAFARSIITPDASSVQPRPRNPTDHRPSS